MPSLRIGKRAVVLALTFGIWAQIGCDRDDPIATSSVPKEASSSQHPSQSPAIADTIDSAKPAVGGIQWSLPAGWKQLPGDNKLRFATIQTDDQPPLSISVVRLNGPSGRSLVMNINRWEGQLKLPPSAEADLGKIVTPMQTQSDAAAHLVDLTGPAGNQQERMLGALIFNGDECWSLLLRGPVSRVAAAEVKFKSLISSIQLDIGTTPVAPADIAPTEGAPAAQSPADSAHAAGLLGWATPAGWEVEPPTSSMRLLSFRAGSSEVVISRFPKAAMSDRLMNINRWRGQVQLSPADTADSSPPTKTTVSSITDADLYEFQGPAGADAHSLLVAVVPQGESFWFFKFLGPSSEIAAQKPAFDAFLKSVRLGAPNE